MRVWAIVCLAACGWIAGSGLVGCSRNEQNGQASGDYGTGTTVTGGPTTTTGSGGEGAGMTGTEGDAPADNPAAGASEEQQSEGADK